MMLSHTNHRSRLDIHLTGPFEVRLDGEVISRFESVKVRALLAYLVVEIHSPHSRESLAELLWPGAPSQSAFGNLRYVLANLRHVLDDASANPPYLLISRESLQFNALSSYELDTNCFINLLQIVAPHYYFMVCFEIINQHLKFCDITTMH